MADKKKLNLDKRSAEILGGAQELDQEEQANVVGGVRVQKEEPGCSPGHETGHYNCDSNATCTGTACSVSHS